MPERRAIVVAIVAQSAGRFFPLYTPTCAEHDWVGAETYIRDGAVFNAAVHNSDVPHVDADEMGTVSLLEGLA